MAHFYEACYAAQTNPLYVGNPLIEALPPEFSEETWERCLTRMFPGTDEERHLSDAQRKAKIRSLWSLAVPLKRNIRLAESVLSMIREGYIGRAPQTAEDIRIRQEIYRKQQLDQVFIECGTLSQAQSSAALIGPPGTGKTTAIKNILARIPLAIYHSKYRICQVPAVIVECAHKGISVKDVCLSILRKIDELVPDSNCFAKAIGKVSAEALINIVARELRNHYVGILIVDEIQNLANDRTNRADLMSFLVSASNALGVPLLLIGTNEAMPLLQQDLRLARRFVEHDLPQWGRYYDRHADTGEWRLFLDILWEHQWLKTYTPITQVLEDQLYDLSQGIPDVLVKFFIAAQLRAIDMGKELLTVDIFSDVARQEMARIKPMMEALRSGNIKELARYRDLTPTLRDLALASDSRMAALNLPAARILPNDPQYQNSITEMLEGIGFAEPLAQDLSQAVMKNGTAQNALHATQEALAMTQPRTRPNRSPLKSQYCEGDLRLMWQEAQQQGVPVLSVIQALDIARPLASVLGV